MKFTHRFTVKAPLARVAEFHRASASMAAITPPPIRVRIHAAPEFLAANDVMDFTLWAGPIPIRWVAQIEASGTSGFTDRQLRGPFACWVHHHRFSAVNDTTTEVIDEIEARIQRHPLWAVVGSLMWLGMPVLFALRGRRTQRLLEVKAGR